MFEGSGFSKDTWKEGAGSGSKKWGRCANIVVIFSEASCVSILLIHDAVDELFHKLPSIHLVIVTGPAATVLVHSEEPLRIGDKQ